MSQQQDEHDFYAYVWSTYRLYSFKAKFRHWALNYARQLLPTLGDSAHVGRLAGELDACGGASGIDSGWHEAAEAGKGMKSHYIHGGGADLEGGYWLCHIMSQLDRPNADGALEVAWAMRRATGSSNEKLLADLKGGPQ